MKLGIMQPYFFPYLGHFDLINYTDRWVVFDTAQYIRHGWINRNRILHPTKGWQYIIVPLRKHPREIAIRDVKIANEQDWRRRIVGQLQHYRKEAPYFEETISFVENCLKYENDSIFRLDAHILAKTCTKLGIHFDYTFFSEMDLGLPSILKPGEWALYIAEAMKAKEYVNPPGGAKLFDKMEFAKRGITLTFRHISPYEYECRGYEFISNLSIIDILMWNTPEAIKYYLDQQVN